VASLAWGVEAMMDFDPRDNGSQDDDARWADREPDTATP
jgi:hypothetical protein